MLDNLYFWKGKDGGMSTTKLLLVLLSIIALLGGGGAGGWYYFVVLPAQKAREEALARQQQAANKLKADIDSVNAFYASSLEGADVSQAIAMLSELRSSARKREIISIKSESFVCDTKKCQFGYVLMPGSVLILPEKTFWGKTYKPSVVASDNKSKKNEKENFIYKDIESRLNKNKLLDLYKEKKTLNLYPCTDVVEYILTYNSFVKSLGAGNKNVSGGEIVLTSAPKTSVGNLETQLKNKVQAYGLMAGSWELEMKGDDINTMSLQITLYKQAYRDAFLIKKIESEDNGIKLSGGLVCKV